MDTDEQGGQMMAHNHYTSLYTIVNHLTSVTNSCGEFVTDNSAVWIIVQQCQTTGTPAVHIHQLLAMVNLLGGSPQTWDHGVMGRRAVRWVVDGCLWRFEIVHDACKVCLVMLRMIVS